MQSGVLAAAPRPDETCRIAADRSPPSPIRAVLTLVALAAVLGACGSRADDDGSATTTGAPTTTAAPSLPATTLPTTTLPTTTAGTITTVATTVAPTTAAPTTAGADPAVAIAQITANWEKFFLAGTPLPEREALLEDGALYVEALTVRSADPLQAEASAEVQEVTLLDGEHAHVVYDVLLGGTVALPDAEGNAVLQDGTWKVSAESFCSLIVLGASEPIPGCS